MRFCQTIIFSFAILILGIVYPRHAFAETKVIINELLPHPPSGSKEWVELYNPDGADISGYWLDDDSNFSEDTGNSDKKNLSELSSISGHPYDVFEVSSMFNNDGDSVVLFAPDGAILDQFTYTKDPESYAIGRSPDVMGNFVVLASSSKGSANSDPLPTATITPSPTLKPTATPKVPTPSNSPTPIKTPTPTKISTNTGKTTADDTDSITKTSDDEFEEIDLSGVPTAILGIGTKAAEKKASSVTAKSKKNTKPLVKDFSDSEKQGFPFHIVFLSLGGVLLIGCAILIFIKKKRMRE